MVKKEFINRPLHILTMGILSWLGLGKTLKPPRVVSLPISEDPMLAAAMSGDWKTLQSLVKSQNRANDSLSAALLLSSKSGHLEVIKFILDQGIHIETRDSEGRTPLVLAAAYRHADIAIFLLKKGADTTVCRDYVLRSPEYRKAAADWIKYLDKVNPVQILIGVGPDASTGISYGESAELLQTRLPGSRIRDSGESDPSLHLDPDELLRHHERITAAERQRNEEQGRRWAVEKETLDSKMKEILRLSSAKPWITSIPD